MENGPGLNPGIDTETLPTPEKVEYGRDVDILVKFIRHGDRSKENYLTDFGRETTRQRAEESGHRAEDFGAVKAIGSTVGPYNETGQGRALETADIYTHEIAGDEAFQTRQTEVLSYETMVSPVPYNHREIYNANLPENFDSLSPEDKAAAGVKAQEAVVRHVLSLEGEQADTYKKEWAGSFAYTIEHYMKVAHRLKPHSRVMIVAGGHGNGELLLQQALIRRDEQGEEIRGFTDLEEIGGQINTSEAFTAEVATDESGKDKAIKLTFDNPDRPATEMYLDRQVVQGLADFYKQLHPEVQGLRATERDT
jgi:hypothetical protein